MPETNQGRIVGVNGNMITVKFDTFVTQNEVAYAILGDKRLKCEVIRVRGSNADLQVFESTNGLTVGDIVSFTGELLSVELGPGLLTMVYDGLQNPLDQLAKKSGFFLERGVYLPALDQNAKWDFTPSVKADDSISAGDYLGSVPEGIYTHYICAPFDLQGTWKIESISPAGSYTIKDKIASVKSEKGNVRELTMSQKWPVKIPIKCYREKLLPEKTLITQQRIIDTFFPVAVGGTFCTPGPFGAGKTVLQHAISQHAQTDVVIVCACGERAGEVVEILKEYPHLEDPRTGRSLMERSIIICNTSSMPVAAREASVYTAITLAEYYRQMGLNALLLADSTSRWAQALREMSGRLEEIPGEEGFPAYLESLIASFYERAGLVKLNNGKLGSVTVGGAVSPAGGNFEEPVTQATLKVVGCFLGLSKQRADSRRFPSIHPLESWSHYTSLVDKEDIAKARKMLRRGMEVNQMMNVVGEEGTSTDDYVIYLKSEFLDSVYLQQNTFDPVDGASDADRQIHVFKKTIFVLDSKFSFKAKEDARQFFMGLRQMFIDWNYLKFGSDKFKYQEDHINSRLKELANA
ncbi:MAG TPA: V-type ATP synthase subunit A [Lentisphaeria bacterium]|nr:MAG: V-type ATP synthase subunit A [Lentisphaerae bacterium GWF2_38_69]HBM15922.1 V-type ATP synthase subunit A [Lentisphaeria bacterium]